MGAADFDRAHGAFEVDDAVVGEAVLITTCRRRFVRSIPRSLVAVSALTAFAALGMSLGEDALLSAGAAYDEALRASPDLDGACSRHAFVVAAFLISATDSDLMSSPMVPRLNAQP